MQTYGIFISYRRQGGEAIARDLCERFTDIGYKVFYDVESLGSGDFDKTLYNKLDDISNELASITGGQNIQYINEIEEYRINLKELGLGREEIDSLIAEIVRSSRNTMEARENIQKMKERLTAVKDDIKSAKDEARIKFAPTASDDEGKLWNKMLHFLSRSMPDDATNCLDYYYDKIEDSDANDAFYAAAKHFIYGIGETGVDYRKEG